MKQRIITGVILVIIVAAVLVFSHVPCVLSVTAALMSTIAVYELFGAAGLRGRLWALIPCMIVAAAVPFIKIPAYPIILAVTFAVSLILFGVLMRKLGRYSLARLWIVIPLSVIFPLFYSSFAYARPLQNGLYCLLLVLLTCAGTDTAAYFTGMAIGKHKLSPRISPKKTVEGFFGGLVFCALLFVCVGLVVKYALHGAPNLPALALFGFLCGALDQYGDLCMSVLKRSFGIKDFGTVFPGHGGVLDRFDSLLMVSPFIYLACIVYTHFFG